MPQPAPCWWPALSMQDGCGSTGSRTPSPRYIRSERLLVELKHADPESPETVSPIKDEAKKLLAENRACRQDVARIGDPALTTALERLDHLLTELASKPEGLDAAAIEKLQRELNEGGLLFEVRVLRSRIPDQQMVTAATRSEGTI